MMGTISPSINLLKSYPSMFNLLLAKNVIPTICRRLTTASSSSVKTTTTLISKEKCMVVSSSFSSPWLMLPSREAKNSNGLSQVHTLYDRCFYDIGTKTFVPRMPNTSNLENHQELPNNVKCIGASHGWLAFINPIDCSMYLSNPLTTEIIQLPAIETLSSFVGACYRKLDDGSFKTTGYIFKDCGNGEALDTCKYVANKFVQKIILTSSPVEKDCMVILTAHGTLTTLAFCKISDDKWTNLDAAGGCYSDVVYRSKENKFYATPNSGDPELEIWDLSNASSPKNSMLEYSLFYSPKLVKKYEEFMRKKPLFTNYLVESSGKLFLVERAFAWHVSEHGKIVSSEYDKRCKYPYKTLRFDVYEFNQEKEEFRHVRDLGDMAFFVGINHSTAVNALEVPGVKANAVYFGDNDYFLDILSSRNPEAPICGGHDFGIYNLEDDSITSPCYPTESKQFSPTPVWILP